MIDNIELYSSSSIEETINLYRYFRNEKPVFWSEQHGAWVISRYNDIKSILFNDAACPANLGNRIPLINKININDTSAVEKQLLYDKNYKAIDFYSIYVKGMPTVEFIKKTKSTMDAVFKEINFNKTIDITNQINFISSVSFVCNFLNFDEATKKYYTDEAKNIDNFLNRDLIQERFIMSTELTVEKTDLYNKYIEHFSDITGEERMFYQTAVKDFINSNMVDSQAALTGMQNGILYLIYKNNKYFNNLKKENINNFLNECLRYITFNSHLARKAIVDLDIQGHKISKGENLLLLLGSGNFDEKYFGDDSYLFNPDRECRGTRLEFGFGPHFCIAYRAIKSHLFFYIDKLLEIKNNFNIDYVVYDKESKVLGSPIKEIHGTFYK